MTDPCACRAPLRSSHFSSPPWVACLPSVASAEAPFDGWPGDEGEQVGLPPDDEESAPGPAPVAGNEPADRPREDERWIPEEIVVPTTIKETVAGRVAMMRPNGKAAIPRGAPKRVRQVIAAANHIVGKPYKWGGGHARLEDRGYDCSGTVSYALIRAGLLRSALVSGAFARRYAAGAGRFVAIYANRDHVYMEVAGLRLDTSAVGDRGGRKGVRWRPVIGKRKGFTTRHPVGL